MRRKFIAGNWKMNGLRADGLALAKDLCARVMQAGAVQKGKLACDIGIFPPATLVASVAEAAAESGLIVGGQDCHAAAKGAHTGDISAAMLADSGAKAVILGHSERRTNHQETNGLVQLKTMAALGAGLIPIVCIGETEAQHTAGQTLSILHEQLTGSLPQQIEASRLVVAYEPVWAIGTGKTPTTQNIADIHGALRTYIAKQWGQPVATSLRILYGGSVSPDNAAEILALGDVDGGLVGGASLDAQKFWTIITSCP